MYLFCLCIWWMETTDKNNLNGVYKLKCEQCNMTYMGETGRKFSIRLKEHRTLERQKDDKSLFGKHTNNKQHTHNYTIPKKEFNIQKRKLYEELEITKEKKYYNNLINNMTNIKSQKLFHLIIHKKTTNHLKRWKSMTSHIISNNKNKQQTSQPLTNYNYL